MRLVHYSKTPVLRVNTAPPQNGDADTKPRGFWVSDDDCNDNWAAWCRSENFCVDNLVCAHDVTLVTNAALLVLSSSYEIDEFHAEYHALDDPSWRRGIAWRRVAEKYDGIVITPYVWSRRLDGNAGWYYGWDCASGCIWNARAVASITIRETQKSEAA